MARYEHLPICKCALDLTVHFEKLVAGFSRYHKYTLGTELRVGSRAVLMQVLRANSAGNAPSACCTGNWRAACSSALEGRCREGNNEEAEIRNSLLPCDVARSEGRTPEY